MAVLDHEAIVATFLAGTYGSITLARGTNLFSGKRFDTETLKVFVYLITTAQPSREFTHSRVIEKPQLYIDIISDPDQRQEAKTLANSLYEKCTFQTPSSFSDLKCFMGLPREVNKSDNNQFLFRFAVEGWDLLQNPN